MAKSGVLRNLGTLVPSSSRSSIITMSKGYVESSTIKKIWEMIKMLEHIDRFERELREAERQKGREEGREEGRVVEKLEIAKNLIGTHNDQEILKITGITPEQLKKLKNEQ
ncbi:hypothetical protein AAGG74_17775 [Bacillus mexicanus]|uniref:hypothetical protein n=1 Tax=Bacillus mexicanus TaxID=2834415 RepID=UPI003D1EF9D5